MKNTYGTEPVRISHGTTVTARTPEPASSAVSPSENARAAAFAHEYGSRCGTDTSPPIDVMLQMMPLRRRRIPGSAAIDM